MLNLTAGIMIAFSSMTGVAGQSPVMAVTPQATIAQVASTSSETAKPSETEQYIRSYFADIPIMIDIARCESEFTQTTKDGNVLRGIVDPQDVGVMQINEHYHKERAAKMNLDLNTVEGNVAYARHLYEAEGARPWMPSSSCWSKFTQLAKK